jgi:hypothetical protein
MRSIENIGRPSSRTERKAYQMPLQFSDKFFDEDPGLIKVLDNGLHDGN